MLRTRKFINIFTRTRKNFLTTFSRISSTLADNFEADSNIFPSQCKERSRSVGQ